MSADHEIAFLPDRLNRQPVVFLGLTDGELRLVAFANLALWLPVCAACGALFGVTVLGLGAGTVVAAGGIWVSGRLLRRLKRGKPAGYHADAIRAWLEDRGLAPRTMLREDAVWDTRAHRRRGGVR